MCSLVGRNERSALIGRSYWEECAHWSLRMRGVCSLVGRNERRVLVGRSCLSTFHATETDLRLIYLFVLCNVRVLLIGILLSEVARLRLHSRLPPTHRGDWREGREGGGGLGGVSVYWSRLLCQNDVLWGWGGVPCSWGAFLLLTARVATAGHEAR